MNPLFLPVKLVERALDDLGALATAARRLPDLEAAALDRADRLLAGLDGLSGQIEGIRGQLDTLQSTVEPIEQLAEVRKGIEPLDDDMHAVRDSVDELEPLMKRLVDQMAGVDSKLDDMRGDLAPIGDLADKIPGVGRS